MNEDRCFRLSRSSQRETVEENVSASRLVLTAYVATVTDPEFGKTENSA